MSLPRRIARAFLQFIGLLTLIGLVLALVAMPVLPRILQVEDELSKADYIVPLAGDWHRLIRAAELYRSGLAPKVVLSNARIRPPTRLDKIKEEMGVPQLDPRIFRKELVRHLGIPEEAVKSFGEGYISTSEEAEAFREFLARERSGTNKKHPPEYHPRYISLSYASCQNDISGHNPRCPLHGDNTT